MAKYTRETITAEEPPITLTVVTISTTEELQGKPS